MKYGKYCAVFAALGCMLFVCTMGCLPPKSPVYGFVYMDVKAAKNATNNMLGKKRGEAYCESIVGVIARGDCSIQTAAKNAHITRISHVDYHAESVLGVYTKWTVIVYGN